MTFHLGQTVALFLALTRDPLFELTRQYFWSHLLTVSGLESLRCEETEVFSQPQGLSPPGGQQPNPAASGLPNRSQEQRRGIL